MSTELQGITAPSVALENTIDVPEDTQVMIEGKKITVTGKKGSIIKDFSHSHIKIERKDSGVRVWSESNRKRERASVNTMAAHIQNMIKGINDGFTYKLKIVYVHFPITLKVEGKKILIQNFLGERTPRVTKIVGDAQVSVKGDDVLVTGSDIDAVAQTAANIQHRTRVKRKDLRKFIDGIFVYSKE